MGLASEKAAEYEKRDKHLTPCTRLPSDKYFPLTLKHLASQKKYLKRK